MRSRRRRERSPRWPWLLAGGAVAVELAIDFTNHFAFGGHARWLSATADSGVFGRADTAAIGASALVAALSTLTRPRDRIRAGVLAVALALIAIDDALGIHDRIRLLPAGRAAVVGAGIAIVLSAAFVLLVGEARAAPRCARLPLAAALALLAAGAAARAAGGLLVIETVVGDTSRYVAVGLMQAVGLAAWLLVVSGLSIKLARGGQSSSPRPHWPALTTTLSGKAGAARTTAPTFAPGVANTNRPTR